MFFKKKNKIRFYCNIDGIDKIMPIIPISEMTFDWKKKSAKEYKPSKCPLGTKPRTVSRCIGINTLHKQGWVIRTWQDIVIETNGDGISFKWITPMDQKQFNGQDNISFHDTEHFKHMKNWNEGSLKTIIKINTGWRCDIPKGYILYQFPVFYDDVSCFTTMAGCYSPDYGPAQLNVPIKWNVLNGKTLIPAGTPIAHLILSKQESIDYEIVKPDKEKMKISNMVSGRKFIENYNDIKNFWKNNG